MGLARQGVDRQGSFSGNRVDRAIIDVGSNTVRMVLYGGAPRAPVILYNEKVTAQLGRDIATTGMLADEAVALAMRGLRRFAILLRELEIPRVDIVATAAVRQAKNGPQFLAELRELGFAPQLLSGEEEARLAAMGVAGAFPTANGLVADLGGGSLELTPIADGRVGKGTSLRLGTLRLPELACNNTGDMVSLLSECLRSEGGLGQVQGQLYLVGGTFRSMAVAEIEWLDTPVTDPHGVTLDAKQALTLARKIAAAKPTKLSAISRISSARAERLPDAASLLIALLETSQAQGVVFSSWGLREGTLFDGLSDAVQQQDPLLAGIGEFAVTRGCPPLFATRVAAWTVGVAVASGPGAERVRIAAIMLALASMQIEPNMRTELARDWALKKRWIGINDRDRAMLAVAIYANANRSDIPKNVRALASDEDIETARGWGLATRLCRRLGGRAPSLFRVSRLEVMGEELVLSLERAYADLFSFPNESDLRLLAKHMDLKPRLQIYDENEVED